MGMSYYGSGMMGGNYLFPGFPILMQLILIGFFFGIVYWIVKSGKFENGTADEILKRRLAKGEISKKEYHDLLNEINKK